MTPESIQAMIDQALLRNSTNGDGSHSSHGDNRRNVQTARSCFYADFMKCQPLNFKGTEGVVGLTRWIEKMESVFNISVVATKRDGDKKPAPSKKGQLTTKRKVDDSSRNNHGTQQQPLKGRECHQGPSYQYGDRRKVSLMGGSIAQVHKVPIFTIMNSAPQKCHNVQPKARAFARDAGVLGHFKRDCPKLKNKDGGNGNAQGWVYAVGNAEKRGNASGNPVPMVVTGPSVQIDLMPVLEWVVSMSLSIMEWLDRCHAVNSCAYEKKLVKFPIGMKLWTFLLQRGVSSKQERISVDSYLMFKAQEYMANKG
ncbi:hypothetical protein Tco_0047757 [Tanacetum coccineum]